MTEQVLAAFSEFRNFHQFDDKSYYKWDTWDWQELHPDKFIKFTTILEKLTHHYYLSRLSILNSELPRHKILTSRQWIWSETFTNGEDLQMVIFLGLLFPLGLCFFPDLDLTGISTGGVGSSLNCEINHEMFLTQSRSSIQLSTRAVRAWL